MTDPLAALRAKFLQRAGDDLAWLDATGGEPRDELLARAHKLAGAAGVFGYGEVSDAAAALEDAIREDAPFDLTALTAALRALPPA